MILVDTSVWISHLRRHNQQLDDLLDSELIFCHPLIIGEISCGHLQNRSLILSLFEELPQVSTATHQEALIFIERHGLMGRGLSFIDIHLLASCQIEDLTIWTQDKLLQRAAQVLHLNYHPLHH